MPHQYKRQEVIFTVEEILAALKEKYPSHFPERPITTDVYIRDRNGTDEYFNLIIIKMQIR